MATERLYELFSRWLNQQSTSGEEDELMTLLEDPTQETDIKALLERYWDQLPAPFSLDEKAAEEIFSRAVAARTDATSADLRPVRLAEYSARRISFPLRWLAAASVILLLGISLWLWQRRQLRPANPEAVTVRATKIPDIQPGGNHATLTLGNGSTIILDSAKKGVLVRQGNSIIQKLSDDQVVYRHDNETSATTGYNTLTTPRGGQYRVTLSDGTRVWLNAASSIRYPSVFTGKDRTVDITGEAYLEVSRDPFRPFTVRTAGLEIAVLGTRFDINAYADESTIQTTLLEGSVRVGGKGFDRKLTPGQQLIVAGNRTELISKADLDQVMAWKNGLFAFTDADLPTIMRQLSRWYKVDVRYEGDIPKRVFNGKIGRSLTLDQVLKVLTSTHVHYTIENGNTLTIRP